MRRISIPELRGATDGRLRHYHFSETSTIYVYRRIIPIRCLMLFKYRLHRPSNEFHVWTFYGCDLESLYVYLHIVGIYRLRSRAGRLDAGLMRA